MILCIQVDCCSLDLHVCSGLCRDAQSGSNAQQTAMIQAIQGRREWALALALHAKVVPETRQRRAAYRCLFFMNVEAYHLACRSCEYIVAYRILCMGEEVML